MLAVKTSHFSKKPACRRHSFGGLCHFGEVVRALVPPTLLPQIGLECPLAVKLLIIRHPTPIVTSEFLVLTENRHQLDASSPFN